MSSREQFEAWISNTTNSDLHRGVMLDRRESGSYRHLATENKWEAWQAAHSSKLEAAEKRVAELEASHGNLREAMAGIHNTIAGGGAYTSLAAILNASKRAYEESANAAGIRINGEG